MYNRSIELNKIKPPKSSIDITSNKEYYVIDKDKKVKINFNDEDITVIFINENILMKASNYYTDNEYDEHEEFLLDKLSPCLRSYFNNDYKVFDVYTKDSNKLLYSYIEFDNIELLFFKFIELSIFTKIKNKIFMYNNIVLQRVK